MRTALPPAKAPVLLFVEDDYDWAFFFRTEFQKLAPHWEIVYSREGLEAMRQLARVFVPQAIVTDLVMPGMGGLELIEWVKGQEQYRLLPIIVLSSSDEPGDRQRCAALDLSSYMVKPKSLDELRKNIRYIVKLCEASRSYSRDWNEVPCV